MDDFHREMASVNVYPLWERESRRNRGPEAAYIWRWRQMSGLLDGAVAATDMTNAERRVLVLRNPYLAEAGRDGAAIDLAVNLQALMPGETARPHRHTMNAIRFVLEGIGASTIVEGKDCPMHPGDMILTPAWTWHEHKHEGTTRAVWVDALDVPVHTYLETGVFEPGPAHDVDELPRDTAFAAGGFAPDLRLGARPYSPLFRYSWEAAVEILEALPANKDGSHRLRYTNPLTGGAVMSTLDCYLVGLAPRSETVAARTNGNCVCVVVEGEGRSRIGETTIEWGPKDIFTLPHNQWATHLATSPARLFQITDRELLRRLDILQEESRS